MGMAEQSRAYSFAVNGVAFEFLIPQSGDLESGAIKKLHDDLLRIARKLEDVMDSTDPQLKEARTFTLPPPALDAHG